jgi:hypothetical protein
MTEPISEIAATLSLRFENHGKSFPELSGILAGSRTLKLARLHCESGKTYLKSAAVPSRAVYLGDSRK